MATHPPETIRLRSWKRNNHMIPKSLKFVTIPLRISSILYLLIALGGLVFVFAPMQIEDPVEVVILRVTWALISLMSVGLTVFIEIVIKSLKKGTFWAWIAGLCLAGLYIPSAFAVLGIFMLIGLLKEEIKDFCSRKSGPGA